MHIDRLLCLLMIVCLLCAYQSIEAQEPDSLNFSVLTGPYLGQEPPDTIPVLFAPGIISTDECEYAISMTPDGKEIYFTREMGPNRNRNILVTRWEEDGWTKPEIASFSGRVGDFYPCVSPEGNQIYYNSFRPSKRTLETVCDIWFVERTDSGWSFPPIQMEKPFNPNKAFFISMTKDWTIYTTDLSKGFDSTQIARSRWVDGGYSDYEIIGSPISTFNRDRHPFIAPDESYIIFDSNRKRDVIANWMFISFRLPDDSWSEPQPLGQLFKVKAKTTMGVVSPDGKYLFFKSGEDFYWVDAKILDKLKPVELRE
ncbi:MAG: PD40 domain-containing protein [candidate division Zixibacteria bacterium]|nr:PD40 domain-containing protein [candidate division Zixibacteria bacterium]